MKHHKTRNSLEESNKLPYKLRTKNWIKVNDDARRVNIMCSQIKFKTTMLSSSLFHYSDANIFVKETITIARLDQATRAAEKTNKKVSFKYCTLSTN